ncbi:uncharacterized protein PHACADRAFT_261507 [Phanerochaete carnosa HHB-10118-sp]|uniref:Uncharacterized protein n=1 Tax=Phanerochaete carnosa (strain HHB-10118-sp) TaxID=650164 RepID=K5USI1_PHACS|nr:uncharacterized protein PHACADRAFT_261507 [Phanerochaete carnosa HHB-10118-sp]EKM52851.1 hypothetical protein PHACADRAFT_261507 [Phanerochaete carnosa HHB-10118-sp]
MPSLLEQLEAGLIDVNDPDAPELCIECENVETGRALIHGILEGRVSAQLRTRPRQVIVDIARPRRSLTIEDILSAPTCISQNDGTISLTAAQRTQWVLRKDVFERRKYLSKLVRAARAARVLAAAGSGAVPCAVNDAEDGMGEQIQQITEDQDEWGGEDVSSGDPC